MTDKQKIISIANKVRKMRTEECQKIEWCKEHNMKLEALLHGEIEVKLREIDNLIEETFLLGVINPEE